MLDERGPAWAKPVLLAAAVYNLVFGALAVLFPLAWFELAALPAPNHPSLWQCIGMIVGVYGVGYLAAATNPVVHWPVVLVGFLGKLFGLNRLLLLQLFGPLCQLPPSFRGLELEQRSPFGHPLVPIEVRLLEGAIDEKPDGLLCLIGPDLFSVPGDFDEKW